MSVTVNTDLDNKTVVIAIDGRFDFSQHTSFRSAYKDIEAKGIQFVVDLSRTDYLDSSALGMLLLLKEFAESISSSVIISGPNKDILDILNIASFDKLFTIK